MATFEFDDITANFNSLISTGDPFPPYTFLEDGVNFTFSAQTGGGNVGLNHNAVGNFFLTNSSGTDVVWTLDAQAPGGSTASDGSFTGSVSINATFQSGTWKVTFHGTNPANDVTRTIIAAGLQTVTAPSGNYSHITFTESGGGNIGGLVIQSLTAASVSCFCAGTRIATPDGPVAVENLQSCDRIITATGDITTVQWLGRQPVDTRLMHPAVINPIRITAGALGNGLPERDLLLSQDHAIALDGYLINAGALVNGVSIYQVTTMPQQGFTYYHVETEAHELLLAEGVAAETFVDYAGTDSFENANDRRRSSVVTEMKMPRISTRRMVPDHIEQHLSPKLAAE